MGPCIQRVYTVALKIVPIYAHFAVKVYAIIWVHGSSVFRASPLSAPAGFLRYFLLQIKPRSSRIHLPPAAARSKRMMRKESRAP